MTTTRTATPQEPTMSNRTPYTTVWTSSDQAVADAEAREDAEAAAYRREA